MSHHSGPKRPSIPAWQQPKQPAETSNPASSNTQEPAPSSASTDTSSEHTKDDTYPDYTTLREQVTKFLQDPRIRDAPAAHKRDFLRSKGVREEDIQELLDEAKARDASAEVAGDAANARSKANTPESQNQQAPRAAPRDIPPIVTYPEFLTQPTSPPPLITVNRIVNAITAVASFSAVTYGLSHYVVKPMTDALTDARHDFASHTEDKLNTMNTKLEGLVTTIPTAAKSAPLLGEQKDSEASDDLSDTDSDPAELYSRDFGTQTSPQISRRPSTSSSTSSLAANNSSSDADTTATHTAHIATLTQRLRSLTTTARASATQQDAVQAQVGELKAYLNEMTYSSQYWASDAYGLRYGSNGAWGGGGAGKKKEDDAVEGVKADIRGIKGVLLSARNFPSSQGRGVVGR